MALSLQFQLEKYEDAIATLKVMVRHWTKIPAYWEQLAGAYLEVGDDRAALDTTMIAYINGMVKMPAADTWSRGTESCSWHTADRRRHPGN